ncbi:MAG: hypothetical protein PF440_01220 [Thiomicrorhabdus sp.]|jgi:hypothetical protein|nr:hypothetical protein [Thiomicrorhabdus sp.]
MKLTITRNENYNDGFDNKPKYSETSNCSISGKESEVEKVIAMIEANGYFEAHNCPDEMDNGDYLNGFDIFYGDVPDFKEQYKIAKNSINKGA